MSLGRKLQLEKPVSPNEFKGYFDSSRTVSVMRHQWVTLESIRNLRARSCPNRRSCDRDSSDVDLHSGVLEPPIEVATASQRPPIV